MAVLFEETFTGSGNLHGKTPNVTGGGTITCSPDTAYASGQLNSYDGAEVKVGYSVIHATTDNVIWTVTGEGDGTFLGARFFFNASDWVWINRRGSGPTSEVATYISSSYTTRYSSSSPSIDRFNAATHVIEFNAGVLTWTRAGSLLWTFDASAYGTSLSASVSTELIVNGFLPTSIKLEDGATGGGSAAGAAAHYYRQLA